MTESVLDVMSGGSKAPGAFDKNSQIGDTVSGWIESVDVWDVRKFGTTEVQTWDDGRPQKQLRIVFQADPGTWTPQGEDDTGLRAHYVKAWNPHLKSLRDALAAVGEKEPKAGGWISIRYDREEPSKSGFPTKIYVYQYQAPASDAAQLMGGGQPQPTVAPQAPVVANPPQQQAPQVQQPAPVTNVHTEQGQVDPNTGQIMGQAAPIAPVAPQQPAQQAPAAQPAPAQTQPPQQQAQPVADPWTGQPAPQAAPAQAPQAAPQQTAPGAGLDSEVMKLVKAGLPDETIMQVMGPKGVTVEQVAQVRAIAG